MNSIASGKAAGCMQPGLLRRTRSCSSRLRPIHIWIPGLFGCPGPGDTLVAILASSSSALCCRSQIWKKAQDAFFMQAELSGELAATSRFGMPKADVDPKNFLPNSPTWKCRGVTCAKRQRPPQLVPLSHVPTGSPDAAGRLFPHGWSHPQVGAWDSPVLTFPPLERVAAVDNFVKSIGFISIWCVSVCSWAMNRPDLVATGEALKDGSLWGMLELGWMWIFLSQQSKCWGHGNVSLYL